MSEVLKLKLSTGLEVEYDKKRLMEESRFFAEQASTGDSDVIEIPIDERIWEIMKGWLDVPRNANGDPMDNPALAEYEKKMFNPNDQPELFGVMIASDFLQMDLLTDAGIDFTANMMRGKTPKQIRKLFSIPMDWSPEEIEELKTKYPFLKNSDVFDPVD